ncbi:MAG: hypothetical protein LAT82_02325 [Nanoarchaeota archaeon]|nr:hypothetical protein [Nanoarchaeota archaeon]
MIQLNITNMISKTLIYFLIISILTFSFSYADGPGTPPGSISDPVVVPPSLSTGQTPIGGSLSVSECQGLFAGGFDPQDNLMASVMGLCLSGILVNLHRLEQNECEKIICEYNAARQGISPIACAKQSAYNTCLITGQGFDVVEGVLIGALRQNIRRILEDPLGFAIDRVRGVFERQVSMCSPNCSDPFSKVSAIGLAVLEIPNAINSIKSLINQLQSLGQSQESACERLEDIREELEQLIAQHEAAQARR